MTDRFGTVREWMTHPAETAPVDCSIGTALARMHSTQIRHLLIVDGDRLVGIVSNRDLRRLLTEGPGADLLAQPVSRIMTEDPVTAAPELPVVAAARLLLECKIGSLPVRDGESIIGVFTRSDALEALLRVVERPGT